MAKPPRISIPRPGSPKPPRPPRPGRESTISDVARSDKLRDISPELAEMEAEVLISSGRMEALEELSEKEATRLIQKLQESEKIVTVALTDAYKNKDVSVATQHAIEDYIKRLQEIYYRSTKETEGFAGKVKQPIKEFYLPALKQIKDAIKKDPLLEATTDDGKGGKKVVADYKPALLNYATKIEEQLLKRTTLENKLITAGSKLLKSDVFAGVVAGAASRNLFIAAGVFLFRQSQKRNTQKQQLDLLQRRASLERQHARRMESLKDQADAEAKKALAETEKAQKEKEAQFKKHLAFQKSEREKELEAFKKSDEYKLATPDKQAAVETELSTLATERETNYREAKSQELSNKFGVTVSPASITLPGAADPPPSPPPSPPSPPSPATNTAATGGVQQVSIVDEKLGNPLPVELLTPVPMPVTAPGKFSGGAVEGLKPYIVGEAGPEVFLSKSPGHIVSNDAIGTNPSSDDSKQGATIVKILTQHTELLQRLVTSTEKTLEFNKAWKNEQAIAAEEAEDETSPTASKLSLAAILGADKGKDGKDGAAGGGGGEDGGGGIFSGALDALQTYLMFRRGGIAGRVLGGLARTRVGGKVLGLATRFGPRAAGLLGRIGLGRGAGIAAGMAGMAGMASSIPPIPTGAVSAAATGAATDAAAGAATKAAVGVSDDAAKALIPRLIQKIVAKSLGKSGLKAIPVLGWGAGAYFALSRLMEGDVVGAAAEAGSAALGPISSLVAAVPIMARDIYKEAYGTFPEADAAAGGAEIVGQRMSDLATSIKNEIFSQTSAEVDKKSAQQKTNSAEPSVPTPKLDMGAAPQNPLGTMSGEATGTATPASAMPMSPAPQNPPGTMTGSASVTQAKPQAVGFFDRLKNTMGLGKSETADSSLPDTPPENVTVEPGVDLSGVDKKLLRNFYGFAREYGQPVTITSGYRSDEKQALLYVKAYTYGEPGIYRPSLPMNPVTINYKGQVHKVPGSGRAHAHTGRGIDAVWAGQGSGAGDDILNKYGLGRLVANDPVHISLLKGGATPGGNEGATATPQRNASAQPTSSTPSAPSGVSAPSGATPSMSERMAAWNPSARTAPSAQPGMDRMAQGRETLTPSLQNPTVRSGAGGPNINMPITKGPTIIAGNGGGPAANLPIPAPVDRQPSLRAAIDGILYIG